MNYRELVVSKLKKRNYEIVPDRKRHSVKRCEEYGLNFKEIVKRIKKNDFYEAFPNNYPRVKKIKTKESYLIRLKKSNKYRIEIPLYFTKNKVIVGTVILDNLKERKKVSKKWLR